MSEPRIGKARLPCVKCGEDTVVIESFGDGCEIGRWRACPCGVKFRTCERPADDARAVPHTRKIRPRRSRKAA
jgi:hypothetical protein